MNELAWGGFNKMLELGQTTHKKIVYEAINHHIEQWVRSPLSSGLVVL